MIEQKGLITVIVPVYNVENYLSRCIESILHQDYTNFELLLIDDGSTDNSGDICEEYKKSDNRIIVFHKKNGGLSSARNYGIENSKGEYISFIDSDDFVAPNYLQVLVDLIIKYKTCISTVRGCKTSKSEIIYTKGEDKETLFSTSDALFQMCINNWFGISAWAKLYRKECFDKFRFPEGKIYEDLLTVPYVISQCKAIASSKKELYFWYERAGSITNSNITEKNFVWFEAISQLVDYLDDNFPKLHDAVVKRLIDDSFDMLMNNLVFDEDYLKKAAIVKNFCNKYWKTAYKNKNLKMERKVQASLASFNLNLYRWIYLSWKKNKSIFTNNK